MTTRTFGAQHRDRSADHAGKSQRNMERYNGQKDRVYRWYPNARYGSGRVYQAPAGRLGTLRRGRFGYSAFNEQAHFSPGTRGLWPVGRLRSISAVSEGNGIKFASGLGLRTKLGQRTAADPGANSTGRVAKVQVAQLMDPHSMVESGSKRIDALGNFFAVGA